MLFGFGASVLSAGLTLGMLTLPVTITASEEALKTVPNSYRDGCSGFRGNQMADDQDKCIAYGFAWHVDWFDFRSGQGCW